MKKNIFLTWLATGTLSGILLLSLSSCKTFAEKQAEAEAEKYAKMTPEERAYADAEKKAKKRFEDESPLPTTPPEQRAAKKKKKKDKSFFSFTPHSKEKRDKLWDMDRPVLIEGTSDDIYPWRSGSQSRSEKMHESHLDRLR